MNKKGFSLIELLVVVAIIGILAAVAIPQYNQYKIQASDTKAKSDLHNAAIAMEAFYGSNNNTYAGVTVADLQNAGYRKSEGVTLTVQSADGAGYVLDATSVGGSGQWEFTSASGQMILKGPAPGP